MTLKRAVARAGFTLIEMAIVLVIIGLIVGAGVTTIVPILQSSKVNDATAKLNKIADALLVYGMRYACLPCPANGALATGGANNGQSLDGGGAAVAAGACTANVCTTANGVVPWLALGLAEADITDPWGNRISYQLSANNTVTTCTGAGFAARNGHLQTSGGFSRTTNGATPCYPLGWITVNDAAGNPIAAGGGAAEGAAFVLVSHGPDGEGARAAGTGTLRASPSASANQAENSNGDAVFVQDVVNSSGGANHFDDIVKWSAAPLLVQLCGSSACGNPA